MSKKLFGKFFIFLLVVGLLFAVAPTKQAEAADITVDVYQTSLGDPSGSPVGNVFLAGSDIPFLAARTAAIAGILANQTSYTADQAAVWGPGGMYGSEFYTIAVIKNIPVGSLLHINKPLYYKDSETPDWVLWTTVDLYYPMVAYTHTASNTANGYLTKFDCDGSFCTFVATAAIGDDLSAEGGSAGAPPVEIARVAGFQFRHVLNAEVITGDFTLTGETTHARGYKQGTGYTAGTGGVTVSVIATNLENISSVPQPSVVYVDPSYSTSSCGGHECYYDAFPTIQEGIDAVAVGGTVNVAAGTYIENVLVNKQVSIIGAGSGTDGTIVTTPTGFDTKVGVFQITGSGTSSAPLLLQDMRVQPVGQAGISVGRFYESTGQNVSYLTLDNIYVSGSYYAPATEQERGFYVDNTSTVDHLTVVDSVFTRLTYGWYLQKAVSADISTVSNVSVTNTVFSFNAHKGFYAEKLTDAVFTACTFDNNGSDNTVLPVYFAPWKAGVDINLKAGTYSDISFIDCNITNNGTGNAKEGVGIAIKARNDGTTYGAYPATLTGVLIQGGTITGNERGIRIGEPTKVNDAITNVKIEGAQIYDNEQAYTGTDGSPYGDLVSLSPNNVDATGNWWGQATGPAEGQIYGDVQFCGWLDAAPPAGVPVAYPATNTNTGDGFCTIQAAIDDPQTLGGHTISVGPGTFVENVVVNKSVTIDGAEESTIVMPAISSPNCGGAVGGSLCTGHSTVFLVAANDVTIKDLTVDGDNPALTSGIVRGGADLDARNGIITNGSQNLLVSNVFVKNIYLRGIQSGYGTFIFDGNTVTNVQGESNSIAIIGWGSSGTIENNTVSYANDAISANHSKGIQFLDNTVTLSGSGIHTDNSNSGGGVADLIQGNSVDCTGVADAYGIFVFSPYIAPTIDTNTVTNCAAGITVFGQAAAATTPIVTQVTNNTITGDLSVGSSGAFITTILHGWDYTPVSAYFSGNTITGFDTGVQLWAGELWSYTPWEANPLSATFSENKIYGNTTALATDAASGVTYSTDFTHNWWGSPCGTTSIIGDLNIAPWYADEGMTILRSENVSGDVTFVPTMSTLEMNSMIACAAPYTTFTFTTEIGDVEYPGGIVIPQGRDHLTFILNDGVKVNATSPCFDVSADYTTIMAEHIGMAACVTAAGSNGIDVADGIRNLTVDGLEIYGPGNDGIHFAGVIRDVVLKDNYIHNLAGNGVYFGAQPVELTPGGIDIHGNLFQANTLLGVTNPNGTAPIDATYNSWGHVDGPEAGDGVGPNVTTTPYTHVDVYMEASGTPWTGIPLNQVVSGQPITFKVMAHVVNAEGVDIKLSYPSANLSITSSAVGGVFPTLENLDISTAGTIWYYGGRGSLAPITGTIELFTVTFTGGTPGLNLPMNLDELSDVFGMEGVGSSANIYAVALLDSTVNVIALPEIDIVPVVPQPGPYTAGLPIEFNITVTNTGGGNFADLNLDFTLPEGALLQYCSSGDYPCTIWAPVTDPMDIGTLASGGSAFVDPLPLFRVIFLEPPTGAISVALMDLAPATDFQLATTTETFALLGNFTVTGTFSMQGRSTRAGIPVTLDYQDQVAYTDKTGTTINQISYNLVIPEVNGGHWLLTTLQPRYLNVIIANNKIVSVDGNETLIALQLKGGNAVWTDNVINVTDASEVGAYYGTGTIADNADVNFDGKVNIQDLALVGGNFDLTSETAYGIGNGNIWTVQ